MLLSALLVTLLAGSATRDTKPVSDSLLAPGVSRVLAEQRAARVRDLRYDLSLDVTAADSAIGRLTTRFTLRAPGDLVLDFRGPRLSRVRVNGVTVADPAFNGHHLLIPGRALETGANRLDLEFTAVIAPAGSSIIRVRDPSDGLTYLYTLLVPSDAQQLFPCFDQPDLKARVRLTLTTPLGWKAVANGALLSADSSSRGTTHVFQETEPISTYLIAFGAGPWTTLSSRTPMGRPITLFVRRSRAAEVDADSILADNDRALTWLERYFDHPYPFGKLDVVLAPAFPFGGMEHPGAIFYSEERFIFREPPTLPQRLGRTATIYHEIAHQWFGDLVTMRWFDDLWLKEGFATYMAARMQAALDPRSEAWKTFYLRNKPAAYAVDMSAGTTPVWQELANLDQAKSNYGAIVYNKAPSVLKQLNYLVGDDAFQAGLQRFVRLHAFGNATWRDLLDAVGTAAGRPLRAWGEEYILRPGLPVLEQRVETRDGRLTRLTLVQRPAHPVSGRRPWPIRTEVAVASDSGVARFPVTLTDESTVVEGAAGIANPLWIFANSGDHAYALVMLDPGSVTRLERSLARVTDAFQRAMLWGALWDLVREAVLAPDRFVRMALRELPRERDEQIVSGVLSRVTRATTAYLAGVRRVATIPDIERALLSAAADTARPYGIRRAHLDALIRVAASSVMLDTLASFLRLPRFAGLPLGAPTRWAIVTRLIATGVPDAELHLAQESARDSTAEGARRAFAARAARPDGATKREYFERYFADSTLNEDWATASLDAFNAPESRAGTLPYLRPALDSLAWIQRHRRIFYLGSWLNAFHDGQVGPEALSVVRTFLAERPDLAPDLRSKVLQAADELERTVRIRARFGDD
jgi:aminopeptidase N